MAGLVPAIHVLLATGYAMPVARMSEATCAMQCPGFRFAHPGYEVRMQSIMMRAS
jgi:hypothetical protein